MRVCSQHSESKHCDETNVHQICILSPWRTSDWTCFWMPHLKRLRPARQCSFTTCPTKTIALSSAPNGTVVRCRRWTSKATPPSKTYWRRTASPSSAKKATCPLRRALQLATLLARGPIGWHPVVPRPSGRLCHQHRLMRCIRTHPRCRRRSVVRPDFCGHPIQNAFDGFPHEFERTPAHHLHDPPPGHTASLHKLE